MRPILPLTIAAIAIAGGCTISNNADTTNTESMKIDRYDLEVSAYPALDSASRAGFLMAYADVNRLVLQLYAASHPGASTEASDSMMSEYARSRGVSMFGCAIRERLGATDSIEAALGEAASRSRSMIPELKWPRLYGIISTYDQAIILSGDSIALIGMNHYLGPDDEAYKGFDNYRRRDKRLAALPAQLTESLLYSQWPYELPDKDATALSRMLYDGAVAWITMRITGTERPEEIIGWDEVQTKWAEANESNAWEALINRKMLYSTDEDYGMRLTQRAPATSMLHPDAPGRMGTWLGMRIIDAYMKSHPDTEPRQLLQKDFYGNLKTLVESGYNPLRRQD
ncbi:hypothetical protein [Muribaculum intestinale]|uniref:gliding motility protein GldB-related protein n=1 Tax=Muribaculum intestinale TaxID=1796646 RepID=UPI0025A9CCCB|nr:hypothetical protein [Muribaculum intestinale]